MCKYSEPWYIVDAPLTTKGSLRSFVLVVCALDMNWDGTHLSMRSYNDSARQSTEFNTDQLQLNCRIIIIIIQEAPELSCELHGKGCKYLSMCDVLVCF